MHKLSYKKSITRIKYSRTYREKQLLLIIAKSLTLSKEGYPAATLFGNFVSKIT